jgi:hypothetical protein
VGELVRWRERDTAARQTELERWNAAIATGSPTEVARAARALADKQAALDPEWIFTLHDKWWNEDGELGKHLIEASGTDPRNNTPSAMVKQTGVSPHIGKMMACRKTMVGMTVETAGVRFSFYVKKHIYKLDEQGEYTSTAELKGIWDILNYLVIIPTWWLPLQVQPFSHAIFFGPMVTCIENMITECALRLQLGLFDFIDNAASLNPDFRTWFGTLITNGGLTLDSLFQMTKTPMYVVRSNPFLDGSPLWGRTVRMETCGSVITEGTKPYGITVDVDLWKPGDPQPDRWANLVRPTYVIRVKDYSNIEGPTKTVLDSAIRTTVDLTGALFGNVAGILKQAEGMEGVYVAPIFGVNFIAPWTMLELAAPGKKGGLLTCEITDHSPTGWRHIIGGKSPKWLNDLMNAFYAYIIDIAMIFLGFTGIPSDLLAGFLNDSFFAFQQLDLFEKRVEVGPYHPAITRFHATGSPPYNIQALFTFLKVIWESRGWTSVVATFRNGEIYTLGKDFWRGMLFSLVYMDRTRMVTDYVENIMWRITPAERVILAQIGDGQADEPPIARHERLITAAQEAINVASLAPNS